MNAAEVKFYPLRPEFIESTYFLYQVSQSKVILMNLLKSHIYTINLIDVDTYSSYTPAKTFSEFLHYRDLPVKQVSDGVGRKGREICDKGDVGSY